MSRPFVIYSPPYNHASAGVRALTNLRVALEKLGYVATMGPIGGHGCRDCPRPPGLEEIPVDIAESIVVFPEIIRGNPSPSPYVVRWLLNRPRYNPTDERPGDGPRVVGLQYSYSRSIDPDLPRLLVPTIDTHLFFPKSEPGRGEAIYVGKGQRPVGFQRPLAAKWITNRKPRSQRQLAEWLRAVDVLVSYDPFSAINFEATLCGTPVLVHPDGKWTREEVEAGEFSINGYCWPGDDLKRARDAAQRAHARYLAELAKYEGDVARFARDAQRRYAGRR